MQRIGMRGEWDGWSYETEEGVIYDPEGNHYYLNEIRALFFFRQWQASEIGKPWEVACLKQELKKRISRVKTPKVIIDWGDSQEEVIHPYSR